MLQRFPAPISSSEQQWDPDMLLVHGILLSLLLCPSCGSYVQVLFTSLLGFLDCFSEAIDNLQSFPDFYHTCSNSMMFIFSAY